MLQVFRYYDKIYLLLFVSTNSNLFGSFLEIYRENGILGYYAGLIPRVIGSAAAIILAGVSTYAINNYIIQEPTMKPYTASTMTVSELEKASMHTMYFRIISNACIFKMKYF